MVCKDGSHIKYRTSIADLRLNINNDKDSVQYFSFISNNASMSRIGDEGIYCELQDQVVCTILSKHAIIYLH